VSFLVERIGNISVNPLPAHFSLANRLIQLFPQVAVGAPLPPSAHTAKKILAIGIYYRFRTLLGVQDAFKSSGNLHTVASRFLDHA
jgi:hypothetical protein